MLCVENDGKNAENRHAGGERFLIDAAERAARSPAGRVALVLHLGGAEARLRPQHRRIARVLLQEAASRRAGQLFSLSNGDLVLLCAAPRSRACLIAPLVRLFSAEIPDFSNLLSFWPLERDAGSLLAYAAARLADPPPPSAEEGDPPNAVLGPPLSEAGGIASSIRRSTAVLIVRSPHVEGMFRPLYSKVAFFPSALPNRLATPGGAVPGAVADPDHAPSARWRRERELLATLAANLGGSGPLGAMGLLGVLHVTLSPRSVCTPPFHRLAAVARELGLGLGVTLGFADAMADPEALIAARAFLRRAGIGFLVGGISPLALLLTRPEALGADTIELAYPLNRSASPEPDARALAARIAAIGAARVVLADAGSEHAILWGLGRGIRRFEGSYVDVMLSATRRCAPPRSAPCAPPRWSERAVTLVAA